MSESSPGLQEDLVGGGLAGEAVPGGGAVELTVAHSEHRVDQPLSSRD